MFQQIKWDDKAKVAIALIVIPWAWFLLTFILMFFVRMTLDSMATGDWVGFLVVPVAHAANSIAVSNIFDSPGGGAVFLFGMFLLATRWLAFIFALICTPIGIFLLAMPSKEELRHSEKKS